MAIIGIEGGDFNGGIVKPREKNEGSFTKTGH